MKIKVTHHRHDEPTEVEVDTVDLPEDCTLQIRDGVTGDVITAVALIDVVKIETVGKPKRRAAEA